MTDLEPVSRRRRRLLLVGVAVVALVAVSVPWLLRDSSSARSHVTPAETPIAAHLRVADRIGSAEQLVSKQLSSGIAARPSDVHGAADADQALGIDLLRRLQSSSGGNLSVSPMSLALALSMLQNGARGKTLAGIQHALHAGKLAGPTLDAGWAALVDDWQAAAASSGFSLQSANSLWLQRGLPTRAAFMSALATYFDTGVWQVDFTKSDANVAINKWTSEQTHGRITKLFDSLDPDTMAVLANAVYFKAAWQQPFDPDDTHPGTFTGPDGPTAKVSFMSEAAGLLCAVTGSYDAVQLPYRGGRFAALAIMPTSGSLNDYVRDLDPGSLQDVVAGLRSTMVQLDVPKFATTSKLDLNNPLKAMGMGAAFSDAADFSALSPVPLQVAKVIQRVYLKVGEKGTEAAAATGIDMRTTSTRAVPPTSITLDHPFLFLIRDTTTGAILFASEIQHPQS